MASNIYIPFNGFQSIGGPYTFMYNLKSYLDKINFKYTNEPNEADSIFFPISFNFDVLNIIRNRGGRIIQRLDGIYYPSKHKNQYVELNKDIKEIYLKYSDFVIFQSEYSRKQCFNMLGKKNKKSYGIITNGVNKSIFYPGENRVSDNKIRFITTGAFRHISVIEPVIKALNSLKGKFDFELVVVGPILNKELEDYFKKDYIKYTGAKNLYEVAGLLRDSHIFLYSHLNPPCPNSVIEAISCALPVVGFESGAMRELCWFSKDLLAPVSDEIFQKYEDFDYNNLAEKIIFTVNNLDTYKKIAMDHAHLYSFDECGRKYIEVFKNQLKRKSNFNIGGFLESIFSKKNPILIKQNIKSLPGISSDSTENDTASLPDHILDIIKKKSDSLTPADSLRFLFDIDNKLYDLEGRASIRYGNGIHTKHRHIKYHDFFIENTPAGSKVLDIGCGNGALTYDIACNVSNSFVFGIDLNPDNINAAKSGFSRENIVYVHGDALKDLPDEMFDIIVLSNVLEHLEKRIEFLCSIKKKYDPKKILLRVPVFERDWRVPLKQELDIDYRLDTTHCIEYLQEDFFSEIKQSGLQIETFHLKWGEIWAVVVS